MLLICTPASLRAAMKAAIVSVVMASSRAPASFSMASRLLTPYS